MLDRRLVRDQLGYTHVIPSHKPRTLLKLVQPPSYHAKHFYTREVDGTSFAMDDVDIISRLHQSTSLDDG